MQELGSFSVQHLVAGQAILHQPQFFNRVIQDLSILSLRSIDFFDPQHTHRQWQFQERLTRLILTGKLGRNTSDRMLQLVP